MPPSVEAENLIIEKIYSAFPSRETMSDDFIESNPYLLEESSPQEARSYLPSFMTYVLKNFRQDPQSMVYLQLLFNLNEYSKCKNPDNLNLNLWFILSPAQQKAVLAFLSHLLHNQPTNFDSAGLGKIIRRWQDRS